MRKVFIILLALIPLALPSPIFAHAFGQLYTLPLPVWLYLYGGAAAVLISFVLIGFFVGRTNQNLDYQTLNLSKWLLIYFLTSDRIKFFFKILSISIFMLTVIAGYIGSKNPTENFSTLYVWIIFWLGFTYLTALFGNLWSVVNPWKIIIEVVEAIRDSEIRGLIKYPKVFGYIPALLFYYIFIWLELLSSGLGVRPSFLSILITVYTFTNFVGVLLFGKRVWFKYFEFFSVFFGLVSKLAPIEIKNHQLFIRPPFVGLVKGKAENFSLVFFILFMLSSTAFDGFRGTIAWRKLDLLISSVAVSNVSYGISQSLLLAASPLFFLILYLFAIGFIKTLIKTTFSVWDLATKFVYSLIPIALAYNIAHYYTLLLVQGQSIIPAISDPFGLGWNLFGTASFVANVGIVGANFVWHSEVVVIIVGHIAAVYIAHLVALSIFASERKAMISQLPMLILMIIYTIGGLWILSQPLSVGG